MKIPLINHRLRAHLALFTVLAVAGHGIGRAQLPQYPDLVVTRAAGPAASSTGRAFGVTNIVRNAGLVDVPPNVPIRVGIYLSPDSSITTNDLLVGWRTLNGLTAGTVSSNVINQVQIPLNVPPGTYHLGAFIDVLNYVDEVDEVNNAFDAQTIEISIGPDLVVSALSAPSVGAAGASITLTNTVQNPGTGFAGECTVGFYLSAQPVVTTNDLNIGRRTTSFLLIGGVSAASTPLTLPGDLTPGNYYLAAIADDTNGLVEASESNNTSTALPIQILSGPDLVAEIVSASGSVANGTSTFITNSVRNASARDVSSSFFVRLYLSTDQIITTSDRLLAGRTVNGLTSGQSNVAGTSIFWEPAIQPGTYYLGAIADADNQVNETNEANNVSAPQMIVVLAADLTIGDLQGPATGMSGGSITITDTMANLGPGWTFDATIGFYLSSDPSITTNDVFLGERSVFLLTVGASAGSTSVNIPANLPPGSYYLGGIADWRNNLRESVETNNTRVAGLIEIDPGTDIEALAVSSPPVADGAGPLTVTNTVRNAGGQDIASVAVGIYLSVDATITTNDFKVASRTISNLLIGETNTAVTSVNLGASVPPGNYYVGMIADDVQAIGESSEINNLRTGNPVQVTSGPDLIVSNVTGPARGPTGSFITFTNVIQNIGNVPTAAPFKLKMVLATNATVALGDIVMGEITVTNLLGAGQSLSVTGRFFVNLSGIPPAIYHLGAVVDVQQQITENSEANNSLAGALIEVVYGPDLALTDLAGLGAASTGGSISLSNTIANLGEAVTPFSEVSFYLSPDAVITPSDILIGQRDGGGLAPGVSNAANTIVTIPTTLVPGTYYLGAIADSAGGLHEADENNNAILGGIINVTADTDLKMSLFAAPSQAGTLTTISITNTVRNAGNGASPAFSLGLYLSSDAIITTNDLRLGSRAIAVLAAGASNAAVTTVLVPGSVTPGSYFLGALADEFDVAHETQENNNTASTAITITSGPDLVVTEVAGPASILVGQSFFITNTVQNTSLADVTAAFSVGIYLSTDASITAGDLPVGTRSISGLGAGQSSTAILAVNSLLLVPGAYHLGAIVDTTGSIAEVNESNNAATGNVMNIEPATITEVRVDGVDLLVTFTSAAGRTYRLEHAAQLAARTVWNQVAGATSIPGTGSPITARHTGALSGAAAFYRVRLIE